MGQMRKELGMKIEQNKDSLYKVCMAMLYQEKCPSRRNSTSNSRSLRNTATDLGLPKKTSANGQKCFSFRGAKLWNSLPAETKQASSINIFKHSL